MASNNQQQNNSITVSWSPSWSMSTHDSTQTWNDKSDSSRNGDHYSYGAVHNNQQHVTEDMLRNHDRILFLIAKLTGTRVQVSVKDGSKYEGILYGGSAQGKFGVVLNHPRKVCDSTIGTSSQMQTATAVTPSIMIMDKDLISITSSVMDDDLILDNGISCGDQVEFGERELHEWEDKAVGDLICLDDHIAFSSNLCEPFAINDQILGMEMSFNEGTHTPPFLDRTVYDYEELERYENEIQQAAAMDIHVLEESNQLLDEELMDEENWHSSEIRRTPADYFIDHKVEVFPVTERDVIYYSTCMDESTIPHFAAPPYMIDDTCTCQKKKKKVHRSVSKSFCRHSRILKGKLYVEKYAQKMENKEQHLAELVRFHQTFKLNMPIPADIEPLLSKTRHSTGVIDDKAFEQLYKSRITTTTTTVRNKHTFKFNVHASEFKPNPEVQEFLAARKRASAASPLLPSKGHRSELKHLTLNEVFKHPFSKTKVGTPPHNIGPIWPFGTAQYNMQFMAVTLEDDYTYQQQSTPYLPYNYNQYQYPYHSTPSTNSTSTYEHSPIHYTTDPQFRPTYLTFPTFSAIQSVTGTATSVNPQHSYDAHNTAFYTPLLPETDTPSASSLSPTHGNLFHQQQENDEYQGYYVFNASPLGSPYFITEKIPSSHQTSPTTDTMIQQPISPQPFYADSDYSHWQL
ncbi:hypothetical protein K492DRAFT_207739 [Lichtheimia hyalospora FSU 10163]|nr:hypothetical protein K492DRAFT_207739 [Lichtheimia hyalospora FSU 10163]